MTARQQSPRPSRGRLSPTERAQIEAMGAAGLRASTIARRLDRSIMVVNWTLTRLGLRAPLARVHAYARNGVPVRSFSAEEDAFIEAQRLAGASCASIGRACGERFGHPRSHATISYRLAGLAARAEMEDAA